MSIILNDKTFIICRYVWFLLKFKFELIKTKILLLLHFIHLTKIVYDLKSSKKL